MIREQNQRSVFSAIIRSSRKFALLLSITLLLPSIVNARNEQTFLNFESPIFTGSERVGSILITVVRSGDLSGTSTIEYATDDTGASFDCASFNGIASSRCDFNTATGTLEFAAGETEKSFRVMISQDSHLEPLFETFAVRLDHPNSGTLGSQSTAIVKILDVNDGSPESRNNIIDRTSVFVRQQYRDFLNRDPDPDGLAFWTDNIDKCDEAERRPPNLTVAECKDIMRVNTSAAFFLSIELRQTGGVVTSSYAAALDRPKALPGYLDFIRDTQAMGRGVIVGEGNWEDVVANNRDAFMSDFVTRGEFVALYPSEDTPVNYVNKLYLHAVSRPASELEMIQGVAEFGNSSTASDPGARGRVLLRVITSVDFKQENSALVYMQYVGYLRRNPNEQPDFDFAGYDFWLHKLNQFNGDFGKAELVKAFVTSGEYRARFGRP
jgi:hypothetical protein